MAILHKFTSAKGNSGDTTLVRPLNWNDDHAIQFSSVNVVLAATARYGGTFDITGLSGLTANKPVYIQQAPGPYPGKGDRQDEAEMDGIDVNAYVVDANTIRAYWNANPGPVVGSFTFIYLVGS
jgi:hypothetical protein